MACAQAKRRHGHALQTAIKVGELQPFLKLVKGVRARNKAINWHAVRSRWEVITEHCRQVEEQASKGGGVYVVYEKRAAHLILEIAESVDADRLIDLVAALWMMQLFRPERFKSQDAFWYALGHVLRREAGAGRCFHNRPGQRTKATYRELCQRTRLTMAKMISTGLGEVAVHIAQLEEKRLTARADQEAKFKAAVSSIK
jgi:hypothetical protein